MIRQLTINVAYFDVSYTIKANNLEGKVLSNASITNQFGVIFCYKPNQLKNDSTQLKLEISPDFFRRVVKHAKLTGVVGVAMTVNDGSEFRV